jgi:hypothetical protein
MSYTQSCDVYNTSGYTSDNTVVGASLGIPRAAQYLGIQPRAVTIRPNFGFSTMTSGEPAQCSYDYDYATVQNSYPTK